MALLQVTLSDP